MNIPISPPPWNLPTERNQNSSKNLSFSKLASGGVSLQANNGCSLVCLSPTPPASSVITQCNSSASPFRSDVSLPASETPKISPKDHSNPESHRIDASYAQFAPKHQKGDLMLTAPLFGLEDIILKGHKPDQIISFRQSNRCSSATTNPYDTGYNENVNIYGKPANQSDKEWKYSPTPSYKRKTAERLLKEHGSPPGVRVTCGGRIVPDNLAPLTSPLYAYPSMSKSSNIYNGSHVTPGHVFPIPAVPAAFIPPNGFVACDMTGKLCQYVNGKAEPVPIKNGIPEYILPVTNALPITNNAGQFGEISHGYTKQAAYATPTPGTTLEPSSQYLSTAKTHSLRHIRALEEQRSDLERELRHLEKQSALHQRIITPRVQNEVVKKRIELTNRIDETRKGIMLLKKSMDEDHEQIATCNVHSYPGERLLRDRLQVMEQFPIQDSNGFGNFMETNFNSADFEFPLYPYLSGLANHQNGVQCNVESQASYFGNNSTFVGSYEDVYPEGNVLQSHSGNAGLVVNNVRDLTNTKDGAGMPESFNKNGAAQQSNRCGRRSHAIQIKAPSLSPTQTGRKIFLDPKSPTYVPPTSTVAKISPSDKPTPNDESSFVPSPRLVAELESIVGDSTTTEAKKTDSNNAGEEKDEAHNHSTSSATTADFFPTNTIDYSNKRHAVDMHIETDLNNYENMDQHNFGAVGSPVTPRKSPHRYAWHSSPADAQSDTAMEIDHYHSAGRSSHGFRAPSNRPVAPPPSIDCHENSGDFEVVNEGHSGQVTPENGGTRNVSAPIMLRSISSLTPTKTEVDAGSPWTSSPMEGAHSMAQDRAGGSILTPVSALLKEASERVAKLPEVDDQYLKGYQDAIKYYMGRAGPSLRDLNTDSPDGKGKLTLRFESNSNSNSTSSPSGDGISSKDLENDFMSQPNINVRLAQHQREVGKQVLHGIMRASAPPPLSFHPYPESRLKRGLPPTPGLGYDHQRYTKAQISINASSAQARGVFQYDGSGDDTAQNIDGTGSGPNSVADMKRSKTTEAPRSPIRETASAAYAKVTKLMSSPDKPKWRQIMWKKRMSELKAVEIKEIQDYKDKHPIEEEGKEK